MNVNHARMMMTTRRDGKCLVADEGARGLVGVSFVEGGPHEEEDVSGRARPSGMYPQEAMWVPVCWS